MKITTKNGIWKKYFEIEEKTGIDIRDVIKMCIFVMYLLKIQNEILLHEKCMKNIQVSLQNYLTLIHTNINKKDYD